MVLSNIVPRLVHVKFSRFPDRYHYRFLVKNNKCYRLVIIRTWLLSDHYSGGWCSYFFFFLSSPYSCLTSPPGAFGNTVTGAPPKFSQSLKYPLGGCGRNGGPPPLGMPKGGGPTGMGPWGVIIIGIIPGSGGLIGGLIIPGCGMPGGIMPGGIMPGGGIIPTKIA